MQSEIVRTPESKAVLGIGIIGFGSVARIHLDAINLCKDATVVAVCSTRKSEDTVSTSRPIWHSDFHQLLQQSNVDVVAICSPSGLHVEHARAALIAGKHVVVEKPLALDLREAIELVELAKTQGLMLASIVQMRFEEQNSQIKSMIAAGFLGKPILAEVLVPWYRDQSYYDAAAWRGTVDGDGGVLLNQALHHMDLLCWFFGKISDVVGFTATLTHDIQAEDTAVASMKFTNGALGVVAATTSTFPGTSARLSLLFDAGRCVISGQEIIEWTFPNVTVPTSMQDHSNSGASDPSRIGVSGHRAQWEDIIHSLRRGSETAVTGQDALDTLSAILRCKDFAS